MLPQENNRKIEELQTWIGKTMDDEERMAEELLEHREKLAKKKEVADAERQGLEEELEREQKKMRVHEQ